MFAESITIACEFAAQLVVLQSRSDISRWLQGSRANNGSLTNCNVPELPSFLRHFFFRVFRGVRVLFSFVCICPQSIVASTMAQ